jgi:hypothetical protein
MLALKFCSEVPSTERTTKGPVIDLCWLIAGYQDLSGGGLAGAAARVREP